MKVHNHCAEAKGYGVDTESGLIHSVQTTAANVHDLIPATELFHGEETVAYADAGYQGMTNRPEMADKEIKSGVAMRPGKRRVLPETPDGRLLDLIETAKAHIRSKGEHPFRVIKQQFGFQKTRLRGMAKNRCKAHVIAAPTNVFLARRILCRPTNGGDTCVYLARFGPKDTQ
jgi:IS5 family transposase